jgi:hypothetical protein
MGTTIKTDAVSWLVSNFNVRSSNTHASKFYIPEKSWTKRSAWWLEIPRTTIEMPKSVEIHLLCQMAPDLKKFHYLKVPVEFFQKELPNLAVRKEGQVSLFLSAEPKDMFVDQRGTGRVSFRRFLVS